MFTDVCLSTGGALSWGGAWSLGMSGPGGVGVPGGDPPGPDPPEPGTTGNRHSPQGPGTPRTVTAAGGTHPTGMHSCSETFCTVRLCRTVEVAYILLLSVIRLGTVPNEISRSHSHVPITLMIAHSPLKEMLDKCALDLESVHTKSEKRAIAKVCCVIFATNMVCNVIKMGRQLFQTWQPATSPSLCEQTLADRLVS